MDDREVVAAIAAGSPAGVAAIYDRYAAILYGYCQWMLDRSAEADQALQDTIVVASGTIADLADVGQAAPVAVLAGPSRMPAAAPHGQRAAQRPGG